MTKKKPARQTSGKTDKHIHNAPTNKPKKITIPHWIVPFILIATFLAYIPALKAGFVNWDDGDYVTDNFLIRDLSNIKLLVTTPVQGNYHPLTMLSLAINYSISGLEAWSYHLFNILFHLVNCFLVFRLALLLSKRNIIIAFTTAILFGIHPMHVESVAWVAERKDVLYGLFFLAGLISYTKYADTDSKKQYGLAFLFFLLSLISKPAAIIFPVCLFCIDLLRKRKLNFSLLIEKIPFFIFAVILGILTISAQKNVGATGGEFFGLGTKFLFGFYGIMMYVLKMILPLNLAPFYPFPPVNETLTFEYFLAPLFFIALAVLFFYTLKKIRPIAFGISFYLVNLLLVLQVFSVGSAVIAERYTYIPYIGLFYAIGWLIDRYAKANLSKAYFVIIPATILFGFATYKQASIWHNGATLWDHTIKSQPSSRAYSNRAVLLRKEKNNSMAIEYYNKAIKLNSVDHESYNNRGNIYFDQGKLDLAYLDYRKALSIKPDYHPSLDNMGAQFARRSQFDSSLFYLNRALSVKPNYKPAYRNRGFTNMKLNHNEEAIKDLKKFLEYQPADAEMYNSIGVLYQRLGKYPESITNITRAIEISPDPIFFLNRSYSYNFMKNTDQAKKDVLTARQGGVKIPDEYATSLGIQ